MNKPSNRGRETEAYFIRTKGMGTQRRAKRPNTVDAHRGVRAVYISLANSCREGLARDPLGISLGDVAYWESSTKDTMNEGSAQSARDPTKVTLTFGR